MPVCGSATPVSARTANGCARVAHQPNGSARAAPTEARTTTAAVPPMTAARRRARRRFRCMPATNPRSVNTRWTADESVRSGDVNLVSQSDAEQDGVAAGQAAPGVPDGPVAHPVEAADQLAPIGAGREARRRDVLPDPAGTGVED